MNRYLTVTSRLKRHAQLAGDVSRMAAWFATHGRTAIRDGSGPIRRFEHEFAEMTTTRFALSMNSGTAALHSAYFAVGVGPGTEVIVPAYTWHASATPVLQCGAVPVFCDIDPATLTIDVDAIASLITERTRAICAVHVWGNPCEMDRIVALARDRGVSVVEDCSHAHGARYAGRPVGSWGDVGCFSLHASKPVAGGEAGIAVTSDATIYDRMLLLGHVARSHNGQAASTFDVGFADLGVKYQPHPFAIYLARADLGRLDETNTRRAALWAEICDVLQDSPLRPITTFPQGQRGGYYRFVVEHLQPSSATTDDIACVAASRGVPVEVEPYGRNLLHKAPVFSTLDRSALGGGCYDPTRPWSENVSTRTLPVCEDLCGRLLAFERHTALTGRSFIRRSAKRLRRVAEEHCAA